ncbi:expansin-B6-like [Phragmites australis]|uniref:expansin-B6-like n=1 Tax=Phragmites australis TaxID=29695 RepID=UPI002D77F675|nr:expansin-B6-like [Phragmites australis]
MAAVISSKVAALVALLSVLAAHGARAEPSYNNATERRALYSTGGSWLPARATWYGRPNGAGPDNNGGACGYSRTNQYPFNSMTSCGNLPLFKDGKGCGACYQIRCTRSNNRACSGTPKTITITDVNYNSKISHYYFDLSGTAFGAMARPGLNSQLRRAGIIDIQFRRVPCNYKGLNVNFHVEGGSNPFYFAVLVEYAGSDGTVVQVDLKEANRASWTPLRQSWGAVWRLDPGHPLKAPFSLRVRSDLGKTLVANNVIPKGWKGNKNYRTISQFK